MTAAKTKAAPKRAQSQNGQPDGNGHRIEAIAFEEAIRVEAEKLWGDDDAIDAALLRKLRPLLRRPIPTGFIEHVGKVTGKPYSSTGVKSVQVQMDRLDNVIGPTNWGYEATHSENGKRCHVVAWIGSADLRLVERDSWGGVNQGSTEGNIWKGSFTNAAKLALARLGPGWEVYVGAADFDPDTDADAAKAQESKGDGAQQDGDDKLPAERAEKLQALLDEAKVEKKHLDAKLRGFGVKKLTDLTVSQGIRLYEWAIEQGTGSDS